jgi:cell division protein FtsI (penicillin-binding protein 3)
MDPTIAQTLTEQMQHVISHPRGTGRLARVPGYRVAGKTGTSRKSIAGGYAEEYTASFAGFAPATRPRLAIAVVISEPGIEDVGGGALAAPVFSRVMAGALRLMNIPPDDFDSLLVHSGRQP